MIRLRPVAPRGLPPEARPHQTPYQGTYQSGPDAKYPRRADKPRAAGNALTLWPHVVTTKARPVSLPGFRVNRCAAGFGEFSFELPERNPLHKRSQIENRGKKLRRGQLPSSSLVRSGPERSQPFTKSALSAPSKAVNHQAEGSNLDAGRCFGQQVRSTCPRGRLLGAWGTVTISTPNADLLSGGLRDPDAVRPFETSIRCPASRGGPSRSSCSSAGSPSQVAHIRGTGPCRGQVDS